MCFALDVLHSAHEPHGIGVLDSPFGLKYAGGFHEGEKHGFGVEVYINGAVYAGGFANDQPSGYGVHTSPFAEKYMGQWNESSRHGYGVCIDSNCDSSCGRFAENELVDASSEQASWESVQEHVQRALLAERQAIRNQEIARARHIEAVLEELCAVGTFAAFASSYFLDDVLLPFTI